jgi:hypothetical protein
VSVPNVLLAQNATNVELAAVVAIVVAAMTIAMTIVVITASLIVAAEQSLLMENS